jgi:predicted hydrolase (HD superfamily)
VYELPTAIAGISALVKNRRVSRKLDEERALEIIKEHGLEDELVEMKPSIKEDAVMAALYEDKLNENEVDQMFPSTVTWALTTKK